MILHITFSILQDPQLAEDAFQETFLKLALYLNQHSLPESEKKRKRFLTVLARHTAIDFLRKQKKIEAGELPEQLAALAPQLTPEEEIINSFSYKRLIHLIDQLSPQYAEVFHLKYFVGLKIRRLPSCCILVPVQSGLVWQEAGSAEKTNYQPKENFPGAAKGPRGGREERALNSGPQPLNLLN